MAYFDNISGPGAPDIADAGNFASQLMKLLNPNTYKQPQQQAKPQGQPQNAAPGAGQIAQPGQGGQQFNWNPNAPPIVNYAGILQNLFGGRS